jgi:hypothetical protein
MGTKNFFTRILIVFTLVLITPCNLKAEVPAVDAVYSNTVKTVQLYPRSSGLLGNPMLYLFSKDELVLEFDELKDEAESYYFKIIHCNADWSVSNLRSIQYMRDFNETFIQNRQFSTSTKTLFTHYTAPIPPMLVSGNFLIKVYAEGNEDLVILTRRFIVIEDGLSIYGKVTYSNNVSKIRTHQMLNFTINYPAYNLVNPSMQLKVVVRQNFAWGTATKPLAPLYVREDLRELEYSFYSDETSFQGGNEYRYFDMRSFNFSGFNVGRITKYETETYVLLAPDKTRASSMYILWEDLNGKFKTENYETGGQNLEADYAHVRFSLEEKKLEEADVYVYGGLSNWEFTPFNRMKYNEEHQAYECDMFLKQGIYNYMYIVKSDKVEYDPYYFEGSYSATENIYDVIVYYRIPGEFYDRIIGYQTYRFKGN